MATIPTDDSLFLDFSIPRLMRAIEIARNEDDLDALTVLVRALDTRVRFTPEPHQKPPDGDWATWLLLGGRGSGKTAAAAFATNEHAMSPPCDETVIGGHRIGIIGPTFGDTVDSCYWGASGLQRLNPDVHLRMRRAGSTIIEWPNGVTARIFGAYTEQDAERLRAGGGRCFDWWEELAAWRKLQEAYDQAILGLRLGPLPRAVASTTPRNRPLIHELSKFSERYAEGTATRRRERVAITRATTRDNPHLDPEVRADLYARYHGTRLGDQELDGLLLDDLGTLFVRALFGFVDGPVEHWPIKVRSWDLAGTEASPIAPDPDWTAGALLTFETNSLGRINMNDLVHVRAQPGDVERIVVNTAMMDGPDTIVLIEQEPGQSGKAQVAHFKKLLAGHSRRVRGWLPSGKKVIRAELMSSAVSQERFSMTRANWNLAVLDEAEAFPDGAHDDIIDCLSQAMAWMETASGMAGPARMRSPHDYRLNVRLT